MYKMKEERTEREIKREGAKPHGEYGYVIIWSNSNRGGKKSEGNV